MNMVMIMNLFIIMFMIMNMIMIMTIFDDVLQRGGGADIMNVITDIIMKHDHDGPAWGAARNSAAQAR